MTYCMGWWPSTTGGKTATLIDATEGGQVRVLGFFGDTVSHLADCCSYYALVSDAQGPYLNRSLLCGSPFPSPTFRPAKLVTWQPEIPNGSNP